MVGALSFEAILKREAKNDISKDVYRHNFKDRVHMSKSRMDEYSNSQYLEVGGSKEIHYKDETECRYVAAPNLTYDSAVSAYDVNTRRLMVCRFFKYDRSIKDKLMAFVRQLRRNKPNIEARMIGMQSNQEGFSSMLDGLSDLFIDNGIKLVEVDLFGSDVRHVAFDAKLGTTYNILMEDRLYRPGELINKMTIENFESEMKKEESERWKDQD